MEKGYEVKETGNEFKGTENIGKADFGGELAREDKGIDLNAGASSDSKSLSKAAETAAVGGAIATVMTLGMLEAGAPHQDTPLDQLDSHGISVMEEAYSEGKREQEQEDAIAGAQDDSEYGDQPPDPAETPFGL